MEPEVLDNIPFNVQIEDVLKGMRLRHHNPQLEKMTSELLEQARALARPKAIYKVARVEHIDENSVNIDGITFTSKALVKNLEKEYRAFPCVCTCGRELDAIKIPAGEAMRAFCFDTIKNYALYISIQYVAEYIKKRYAVKKISHMNPGEFMDWPLSQQKQMFTLFSDSEKLIGVTLTDSNVMKPEKSRSGIYFSNEVGFESCQLCTNIKCPGRRAKYDPELAKKMTG